MPRTSQSLNKLYESLITNSPQTVSLAVPEEVGTGRIAQTTTKHGVVLSDWQMTYTSDVNVQGINSEEYVNMIFCLKEGVSWGIMDERRTVSIQTGQSCIYRGHGKPESMLYTRNRDFLFKGIKIPAAYFSRILADYFEGQEIQTYEKKLKGEISKVAVTPAMSRILAETRDFVHYQGGLGYLYLDSKILELLAVYLSDVLELDILSAKNASMTRTDRTAILEARRIIDQELAYAPTCEELAQIVHLSVTKLTRGFSDMFGLPVHAYIIEQRLSKAAQLLLEGNRSVSEVAAMVGYLKPSNFSAAFKKKYGVVPKLYKRAQLLDERI